MFLPSGKTANVRSIEIFGKTKVTSAGCGQAIGITLDTQLFVKASDLVCRTDEKLPVTAERFCANIFWMSREPLLPYKKYKLKLGTNRVDVVVEEIESVLDASELERTPGRNEVRRNEVAQCILRAVKPVSFDLIDEIVPTGRFVLVDEYDIAGGGIITSALDNESVLAGQASYHPFEIELNKLIRKHFPHWEAKSVPDYKLHKQISNLLLELKAKDE